MDDRSGPVDVVESLVNALHLKQYVRAYSYWSSPAGSPGGPPPFDQFQQGYANTQAVQLVTGQVTGDVGAGQLYYSLPAVLIAQNSGGAVQTFASCYVLHLARPEIQDAPPFHPLGVQSVGFKLVANNADRQALSAGACQPGGVLTPPTPAYAPDYIGVDRYLDNRSGPVELLRSLFNAINSQQCDRAFSYWSTPADSPAGPSSYDQFKQGYADTASVQLKTGTVSSGVGARQIYYQVPVTLVTKTTGGAPQTFVGCYTLHLARPEIQGVPPFQPLGINTAAVKQVPNDADIATLIGQACH